MRNRNRHRGGRRPAGETVPQAQTRPDKAVVAAVVTLLGLVGIHVTTGTAQALVMLGQLLLVVYGVWRTRNRPKAPGRGVSGFLS